MALVQIRRVLQASVGTHYLAGPARPLFSRWSRHPSPSLTMDQHSCRPVWQWTSATPAPQLWLTWLGLTCLQLYGTIRAPSESNIIILQYLLS